MKIIKLEAQNIKRLRAITIHPRGAATLIGGRNAQGKSSTLDAIEMALGGTKTIPEQPIRNGAKKGHVVIETDELLIERKFSSKGSKLVVRNRAGIEQKSPQALLDSLYGTLAFDPLKFSQDKPKKQAETIRMLAGLDFSELDEQRDAAFSERTDVNRETKRLTALLETLPEIEGVPVAEVSVEELRGELAERNEQQAEKSRLEAAVLEAARVERRVRVEYSEAQLNLEELEHRVREQKNSVATLRAELLGTEEEHAKALSVAKAFTPEPVEETLEKLSTIEDTNRKVRANAERVSVRRQLSEREDQAEQLTSQIESVDERKAAMIEEAKLPIPGLAFTEDGPTLNGIALAQCSQAERLRVSVAVGLAFNPKLRVMLVREGAFLDEDALALLAQLAEEADAQMFIERVGDADAGAIIIEDGVVGARSEAAE